MLCLCSFIILSIHTESNMQSYFRGAYIRKDIWVTLKGAYILGAYTWDFTAFLFDTQFFYKNKVYKKMKLKWSKS